MRELGERFILLDAFRNDKVRAYDKLLAKFVVLRQIRSSLGVNKIIPLLDHLTRIDGKFLRVLGYDVLEDGSIYTIEEIPPQEKVDIGNLDSLLKLIHYIGSSLELISNLGLRAKIPPISEVYIDENGNYLVSPIMLVDFSNWDKVLDRKELLNLLAVFVTSFAPPRLKESVEALLERNIISKLDNVDAFVNMLNTLILQEERMNIKPTAVSEKPDIKKERRKTSPWIIAIVVLLSIAILSVVLVYTIGERYIFPEGAVPEVIVPDITNKPINEAYNILRDTGLNMNIKGIEYNNAVPACNIISQDPSSGVKVKAGRSISVVISKGIELISVPNVIGQDLGNARKILETAGLRIGDIQESYSRTSPDGIVVSQNPKYGSITNRNALVALEITRHIQNTMPNFIGKTLDDAQKILDSLGPFKLTIRETESDTPGIILSQNPSPNTPIIQEIPSIELTVGIPQKAPQVIPAPTQPESGTSGTIPQSPSQTVPEEVPTTP
ncbi:MAG: PASTA domain-containing protein [bacterium]